MHPVPHDRDNLLAVTEHLLRHFAAAAGKLAPALSEDAARFLAARHWTLDDLARRLARAVVANRGSLITATDLRE